MLTPKILLEQRIKKGMSQEEVAKAIGVSQRSYSNYENGTRNPKIDKIIKLAKLLEIKLTLITNVLNDKKNENKLYDVPKSLDEQLKYVQIENKFLRSENESLRKTVGTKDEKIAELNKKIGGLEMAIEFKNHTIDSAKKVSLPVRKTGSK